MLTIGAVAALTAAIATPASAELGRHPHTWVPTGKTAVLEPPETVIAVAGATTARLYAKTSTEANFRDLGGVLTDAPAVAYWISGGRTYYVVKGTSNALYVRTDTTPFSMLVPSAVCRFAPAVAISGDELTVACIGTNYALYYGTATLRTSESGNPSIPRMVYQGGIGVRGPDIFYMPNDNVPNFVVVNIHDPATAPNISVRAATDPPGAYIQTGAHCADQPDLVGFPDDTTDPPSDYFFGCRYGDPAESTDALFYEWNDGTGSTAELDGIMRGRVGIAAAEDLSVAVYYVTGADGHVYSKQVESGSSSGGDFVYIGGRARPGVAAATISSPSPSP